MVSYLAGPIRAYRITVVASTVLMALLSIMSCNATHKADERYKGRSADELFEEMRAWGPQRREVAAVLATHPDGEPWIMWLLLSDNPFMRSGDESDTEIALDNAAIAAMIEAIPDNTSDAVLLALTKRVTDEAQGRYPKLERGPLGGAFRITRIQMGTQPLGILAQQTLQRILGVDHGTDEDAWVEEITSRE